MRAGIAVGAVGVAVTGLLWWGSQDQTVSHDPDNRAARFVPADGHRVVGPGPSGAVYVDETARLTGLEALTSAPPLIGGAILSRAASSHEGDDPRGWSMWRSVETAYADGSADEGGNEQATTLVRLDDVGLETLADYGPLPLVYDPPLLSLPADVHDGSRWSSHGSASTDGSITYSDEEEAADADHGCLHVTGTTTYVVGHRSVPQAVDSTWCPGRGVVADKTADAPAYTGGTAPAATGSATSADVAGWSAVPGRVYVASALEAVTQTKGAAQLAEDLPPAVLPQDGVAVVDSPRDDVWGVVRADHRLVRAWVGHPGGDLTALGTAGTVTVVTTTRRRAVAYGDHGQWLWSRDLGDVARAAPYAVDADHLLITDVQGHVDAVDPATGHRQWHGSMSDQVDLAPVSDGQHVAVADLAGQVRVFDTDTGRVVWTQDLPAAAQAMAVVDGLLVVLMPGVAEGLSLADGAPRWSAAYDEESGLGAAVVGLGDTVVLASEGATIGLDAATGARRWRGTGGSATAAVGQVLVVQDSDRVSALGEDGTVLAHWSATGLQGTRSSYRLTATNDGVLLSDTAGNVLEVGP